MQAWRTAGAEILRNLSALVDMMTTVKDWRSLPKASYWLYRVRVYKQNDAIWLTRLYVKRTAAENMRAKYSKMYRVTVEVSSFVPAFVPVSDLDSVPVRRESARRARATGARTTASGSTCSLIAQLRSAGHTWQAITDELNRIAADGRKWYPTSAKRAHHSAQRLG